MERTIKVSCHGLDGREDWLYKAVTSQSMIGGLRAIMIVKTRDDKCMKNVEEGSRRRKSRAGDCARMRRRQKSSILP